MAFTKAPRWFGKGAHRTRTIEWITGELHKSKQNGSCGRWVATTMAKAECVCGWSEYADDRPEARRRARAHRSTVTVLAADLEAFVWHMGGQCMSMTLFPALERLAAPCPIANDVVEVALADLRPLLREANRPYAFQDHPFIPRLIASAEAASPEKVGMIDSVRRYCELVASAHGFTLEEWIQRVTPVAER